MSGDAKPRRGVDEPANDGNDDGDDDKRAEEVDENEKGAVQRTEERERKPGEEAFSHRLQDGGEKNDEPPENQEMEKSRKRLAQELRLTKGDREDATDSLRDSGESVFLFPQAEARDKAEDIPEKECKGRDNNERKDERIERHTEFLQGSALHGVRRRGQSEADFIRSAIPLPRQ